MNTHQKGVGFAVASACTFSLMGVCIKFGAQDINQSTLVFYRNLCGLILLTPLVLYAKTDLKTQRPTTHLSRCLVGLAAMYCFFYAIQHMSLANAMLLNYSAPLYLPFLAWFFLKERPKKRLAIPLLVGMAGIALIVRPSAHAFVEVQLEHILVGVLAGVLAAQAFIFVRLLSSSEPTRRIVFYFALLSTLFSGIPYLIWGELPPMSMVPWLLGIGLFGTLGQLALTQAYSLIPAAQAGGIIYTVVLFSAIWDWLFWQILPTQAALYGSLLVIISAITILVWRNSVRTA